MDWMRILSLQCKASHTCILFIPSARINYIISCGHTELAA